MTDARCPRCPDRPPLEQVWRARIGLDTCPRCSGTFLARSALDRVVVHPEHLKALRDALDGETAEPPAEAAEVRYLTCAHCDQRMARRNYGQRSGVIIDACVTHGTWFDAQELRKVLDFVAAGGLAKNTAGPRDRAMRSSSTPLDVAPRSRRVTISAEEVAAVPAPDLAAGAIELVLELAAWAVLE